MLDSTTLSLFSPFPRNSGNPLQTKKSILYSEQDFEHFLKINNGVRDVFVSTQPVYGSKNDLRVTAGIDKVFFDIDNNVQLGASKALLVGKIMYEHLTHLGFETIPIASGKKGIHLYVKFKPYNDTIQNMRNARYNAAYGILLLIFKKKPIEIDTKVFGDIRRLCRIPGSLRPYENKTYCTYLPPDFIDFTLDEFNEFIKDKHEYSYSGGNLASWFEFEDTHIPNGFLNESYSKHTTSKSFVETDYQPDLTAYYSLDDLQRDMRPCLFRHAKQPNPSHFIRLSIAKDLLMTYKPEQIAEMLAVFNWHDYDYDYTLYQIESLIGKEPYSCFRLRQENIPEICCLR